MGQSNGGVSPPAHRFVDEEPDAFGPLSLGRRLYAPSLRRWLAPDPLILTSPSVDQDDGRQLDLYGYAANNPVVRTDLEGTIAPALMAALLIGIVLYAESDTDPVTDPDTGVTYGGTDVGAIVRRVANAAGGPMAFAATVWEAGSGAEANATRPPGGPVPPAGEAPPTDAAAKADAEATAGRAKARNRPPDPLPEAQGEPHTIIERPGPDGQYTTHNGDGTFKQYRGSGKDHGGIPRPNVKENKLNRTPDGREIPGKAAVRPARPDEIPGGGK